MLPVQCQGPGGPISGGAAARQHGAAQAARAWQAGHLILVAGSGQAPASTATVGAVPQPAVAAATLQRTAAAHDAEATSTATTTPNGAANTN